MHSNGIPEPILVTRPAAFHRLVQALSQESLIAVDTEANSLHAYQEQVCLIQFSTTEADYLVDPILLEDVSPLGDIFTNPNIEKIFHAAEYDLIILQRDFGFKFQNLFDTMLAARILGWEAVGLGTIIEKHFEIKVNKKYQRADWGRRPLNLDMMHYAQLDTHFLIDLRGIQKRELEKTGRWPIAQEDFQRACQVRIPDERDTTDCWRVNGSRDLDPAQMGILQELCDYRDQVARSLDRPLFKVLNDKTMISLVDACPQNLDELVQIHGISTNQARRHGRAILNAIQRGLQKPCPPPPQRVRPDECYLLLVDVLRHWRKKRARNMGVESDVILPKDLLTLIAQEKPVDKAELARLLEPVPWRLENFGDELLALVQSVNC